MPTLKDFQNTDELNNPSSEAARSLVQHENQTGQNAGVNAGIDQAEQFANDPANASKNINDVNLREQTPNQFNFKPNTTPRQQQTFSFKGVLKKKGPLGLIALLLGGFGGMTLFFSPGIALVQLKEILTDDLNDQLGAMDIRSTHVFRAKLSDIGSGVCTGVKIRCGFKGMSDRQLGKFKAAGIDVETDGKTAFGKNKIKSISVKDSAGNTVKVTNPKEMNRLLGDRMVRNSFRKAFNPKFAGFYDKVSDKVFGKFNTHKGDKIGDGTTEEKDKALTSAVEGEPINVDDPTLMNDKKDDGTPIKENEDANKTALETVDKIHEGGQPTTSLFSSTAGGALKGIGLLGASDSACTVKNTLRAVEAGAKIYRQRQLIDYAMVFLTFADEIKAGTATPERAEYVGNKLTAIDTDKTVINENSMFNSDGTPTQVENPYYGKNAFDSPGYKTALYNEAPTLSARDMQFAIGGGVALGSLAKINDFVNKYASEKTCHIVQNPVVRAGSFAVGIAAAVGSLGLTTFLSIGASVGVSMALPMLQNYMAQMIGGTVANGSTKGVDAGNAIFSGTAGLMGAMAMARGLKPSSKSDLKTYTAMNEQVKNEYVAMEKQDATKTPFDVNNRYSFLGSLTRTLLPLKTSSSISLGSSLTHSLLSIIPIASSTLSPVAKATGFNEDRYGKCADSGYAALGIDADIFCNVRYSMSPFELSLDTDEVMDWMITNHHINPDDGTPLSADYIKWKADCTDRKAGWGEDSEPEAGDSGAICVEKTSPLPTKTLSYFRVFTMDTSIIDAMDYEPPVGAAGLTGGSNFRIASFNMRGASHDGDNGTPPWTERVKHSVDTIQTNHFDIVGFQEFEPPQYNYVKSHLTDYELSSHGKQSDSIMWNTTKFEKVDMGTWQSVYFGGAIQEPWVKLKDKSTQQEFFVMNVHDPINRGQGDAETRYQDAVGHLAQVNKLKTQAPVLLTGDFNSAYSRDNGAGAKVDEKLTYCVLTKDGAMNDAYDLSVPREAKCPNKPDGDRNYIDHIYLTPEIQVGSFNDVKNGYNSNGSDHPTIYSDVIIPGSSDNTGGGSTFNLASFNICYGTAAGGIGYADCAKRTLYSPRLEKSASTIESNNLEVVGLQEVREGQWNDIKSGKVLSGYDMYPKGDYKEGYATQNPVIWDKSRFSFTSGSLIPGYTVSSGYNQKADTMVQLKDTSTGQEFIVINVHEPVGNDNDTAKKRMDSAKDKVALIKSLRSKGVPIFMTGDFNSKYAATGVNQNAFNGQKDNLPYCILTNGTELWDAFDATKSKTGTCPSFGQSNGVDHIYMNTNVTAKNYKYSGAGVTSNGSDHNTLSVNVTIPGSGPGSGTAGKDVIGDDYATDCGKYLSAGDCTGECVGFVKYRLVKHGVIKNTSLGNGGAVVGTLGGMGFKVNDIPAVHSVFSMPTSSVGHTGIVSAINKNDSIVVEEYNWPGGHHYNTRTLSLSEYRAAGMKFAHTEVKYK